MPYITCDGKTYSRYDSSQFVKDCIAEQKEFYRQMSIKCSADPECVSKRQFDKYVIGSGVFIIIFIFLYLIFTVLKND